MINKGDNANPFRLQNVNFNLYCSDVGQITLKTKQYLNQISKIVLQCMSESECIIYLYPTFFSKSSTVGDCNEK